MGFTVYDEVGTMWKGRWSVRESGGAVWRPALALGVGQRGTWVAENVPGCLLPITPHRASEVHKVQSGRWSLRSKPSDGVPHPSSHRWRCHAQSPRVPMWLDPEKAKFTLAGDLRTPWSETRGLQIVGPFKLEAEGYKQQWVPDIINSPSVKSRTDKPLEGRVPRSLQDHSLLRAEGMEGDCPDI